MRIGIVDDHPVFRLGLRQALSRQPGISVLWDVGTERELADLIERQPADVVLLDVNLGRGGGAAGVATARSLSRSHPAVRVVMISAFVDDHLILAARRAGAAGYLAKDLHPEQFVASLRVLTGQQVSHRSTHDLMHGAARQPTLESWERQHPRRTQLSVLTPREFEVLSEMRQGHTNAEIAKRLGISKTTINKHVHQVLRKLNARNRAHAATLYPHAAERAADPD